MIELALATISTGIYEPLTYLVIFILFASCTAYLIRHYLKVRENITLLFIAFFGGVPFFAVFCLLILMDVINFDLILAIVYMFLVSITILAVIGLVMLGIEQLYTLPLFVATLAFFHYSVLASNHVQIISSIQIFSLLYTGELIGSPWYIALKYVFPNILTPSIKNSAVLNLIFDPLELIFPDISLGAISLYLSVIVLPTIILFYILAWKNRSGRSLGFALGLTTYLILGALVGAEVLWFRSIEDTISTFIGSTFFALGILGLLDKLVKKEKEHKKTGEK